MKLKTNVKIDFNDGLFERKKDFFEAEIKIFEVIEFKEIRISGQYYYTAKDAKVNLKSFNINVKKSDFNDYLAKLGAGSASSMDVIENIFYFILKEEMAKEFSIDITTIDIIDAVVIK
jgi:hypothetical protein